jgi:DNA-binding GntR family transcriptional regulator
VAALEPAALDDAYRVRAVLLGLAARQEAERQGAGDLAPAALAAVEAAARTADRHTRAGRLGAAIAANRAFHLGIVELAANRELETALVPIWDRIQVTTRAELRDAARAAAVDDEHGALLDAIRAGRPGAARRAAEAHVDRTRRLALAAGAGRSTGHGGGPARWAPRALG